MTKGKRTLFRQVRLMAVLAVAAGVVLAAASASAKYMSDGATQNGTTGGWNLPSDLVCIVGLHMDGTLDIAPGVTDSRDCIYRSTGLTGLNPVDVTTSSMCGSGLACNVAANCTGTNATTKGTLTWNATDSKCYDSAPCTVADFAGGSVGGITFPTTNNGAKHALATSICVDGSGNGISLTGVDRTAQMCAAKGGIWKQTSATPPPGFPGIFPTAGFGGACVAYSRQFKGQDANGAPLTFGSKGTATADAGYCYAPMDWTAVYPTASCPSLKATTSPYDAGAAYDWSVGSSQCRYSKSIAGKLQSALTKANGTTIAAGTFVDLSTYTTMGDCLANGGTWNNWVGQASTVAAVVGANTYKRPGWDYTTQAPDADEGCLHCHSATVEYNGPAERQKDTYLETGHKNMLRKVTAGKSWAGPDGVIYTQDTASHVIDFAAATVGGGPLYFLFGDWMAPLPNAIGPNGDTPLYGCGACHTSGFKDGTNPGVQSIGTPGYMPAQPVAPASTYVTAGHKWDLEGIHCSRCHNATVAPVNATQIAASSFETTAPTSGGMGALAAGTGRTNLCFGCHQSIAKAWPSGASQFDPTLIPTGVSHGAAAGRDFNGHVLGNSFLNSVHGKYAGAPSGNGSITLNSLGKYDLTDPNGTIEYGSLFKGYTCWQGSTSNSPAKTKADGSEITTKSDCETLYGVGSWRADASGDLGTTQGTCTTCHDVHNSLFVESQKEAALRKKCEDCHVNNSTTGATDAAAPQVVVANTNHLKTGGTPFDSTKYDSPCVVCHMATQAKVNGDQSSYPVHVWRINTSASYNTFPTTGQFYGGTCSVHSGAVQNAPSLPVVYLSDTSSTNCTGATPTHGIWTAATKDRNAQVAPDGTYANAVWVDLDLACGQCHGGSLGPSATHNGALYRDKATLAAVAKGMHASAGVPYPVTFSIWTSGLTANVTASVGCTDSCPSFDYDWNWGDATPHGSGASASHLYGSGGAKSITLTVTSAGGVVGSVTRSARVTAPDLPPTAAIFGGACTWTGNTWTMTLKDASTDDHSVQTVYVEWGDDTRSFGHQGSTFSHTYLQPGTYAVTLKAIDSALQLGTPVTCPTPATPTYFTIGGTVFKSNGTTVVPSAAVTVRQAAGGPIKTVYSAANGMFSAGSLKPGTYTLTVTKAGYTFAVPAATITVGPSSPSGNNINAITP